MLNPVRIKKLNNYEIDDRRKYMFYWMQASQRLDDNFALEYMIYLANEFNKIPVVYFCLTDNYPGANRRHYYFMLQGILEIKKKFEDFGIVFKIVLGKPLDTFLELEKMGCAFVFDKGYTRVQREWREEIGRISKTALFEVEDNVFVPVELASSKEEYGAYTIRKKLWAKKGEFENERFSLEKQKYLYEEFILNNEIKEDNVEEIISKLKIDNSVREVSGFIGGEKQAEKLLWEFVELKLAKYEAEGNIPGLLNDSNLSPYLHFGNISPLKILRAVEKEKVKESFIEQLFVRRELAVNFTWYNENYDNFKSLKENWIMETIEKHRADKREIIYSLETLENYRTHDKYWNAAQKEMVMKGKMNSYMRMYWGKKIIEWTESAQKAYEIMVYLNDKYELDGRDSNGYAGIAWCFGKHDRAWTERAVFGKIRYMNDKGLERKFDMEKYIENLL